MSSPLDLRCNQISDLINQGNFRMALGAAHKLVRDVEQVFESAAERPAQVYFLLHLAHCLDGNVSDAELKEIIGKARQCRDFTDLMYGDMLRDQMLMLLRSLPPRGGQRRRMLGEVGRIARQVRPLHASDQNRVACLIGTGGRLSYAQADYKRAAELHANAQSMWTEIGSAADAQWIYNNLIPWLKAVVASGGRRSDLARQLVARIASECPTGARNRSREARAIMVPVVGRWLHSTSQRFS